MSVIGVGLQRNNGRRLGDQTVRYAKFVEPAGVLIPVPIFKKNRPKGGYKMAVGQGFEPREPLGSTVFKTAAFDHSASPPKLLFGPAERSAAL